MQTRDYIDNVLSHFGKNDCLLLQNEINLLDYIIERAYEIGMKIVLNPSPFDRQIEKCDLNKVKLFMMNEIEGQQFTGSSDPHEILYKLQKQFPDAEIVLTLGSQGAFYYNGQQKIFQGVFQVETVDTTAAGDTFTGFYIASVIEGKTPAEALRIAAQASAIAVTRPGAVPSIPSMEEVMSALGE